MPRAALLRVDPAEARIDGNKITVKNMEMKKPRFVRYAWQPFTRANVVNGEGLPLSTFKTAVDGSFEPEEGLEYGVSAPFAGRFADRSEEHTSELQSRI